MTPIPVLINPSLNQCTAPPLTGDVVGVGLQCRILRKVSNVMGHVVPGYMHSVVGSALQVIEGWLEKRKRVGTVSGYAQV